MCIWVAEHYISWSPSHSCTQIFQFASISVHHVSALLSSPHYFRLCFGIAALFLLSFLFLNDISSHSLISHPDLILPSLPPSSIGLCGFYVFSHLSYCWWPRILPQNLISITPYSQCLVSLFNLPLLLIHRQENLSGLPGSWSQQQMVRLLDADIINLSACMFCIIYEAIMKNSFSRFQANAVFPCKDYDWTWP